jgi:hypothetical protein
MFSILRSAVHDPIGFAYRLRSRFDRPGLWARYGRLARAAGLDRLYFVLSFDCDTMEDIEVAWSVHERVTQLGAKAVYAVPGELLVKGAATYRRILEAGGEFINHGYVEHTYFDAARGDYASCFFYDQQTREAVRADIIGGDRCLRQTLGVAARGFRTPHFGTFQDAGQLDFLYRQLAALGYAFSTSTVPLLAFRHGPIFSRSGIKELPVSGMDSDPYTILDTWGCFRAPDRIRTPEDYLTEGRAAADSARAAGAGLLNFYADPSHIHDQEDFFDAVEYWCSVATPVTYRDLLG